MSLRELLDEKPQLAAAIAVIVLVVAGLLVFKNLGGSSRAPTQKWMYDLNSDRLMVRSVATPSPSDSEGTFDYPRLGTAGSLVNAVVFTCADSGRITEGMSNQEVEAAGAKIGYLLRQPDNIVKALRDGKDVAPAVLERSLLMSGPQGDDWFRAESTKSDAIKRKLLSLCDGEIPRQPSP